MLRAQGLAKLGLVNLLEPEALTTERLAERIVAALAGPKPEPKVSIDLRGLECVTHHILAMAHEREESSGVRP